MGVRPGRGGSHPKHNDCECLPGALDVFWHVLRPGALRCGRAGGEAGRFPPGDDVGKIPQASRPLFAKPRWERGEDQCQSLGCNRQAAGEVTPLPQDPPCSLSFSASRRATRIRSSSMLSPILPMTLLPPCHSSKGIRSACASSQDPALLFFVSSAILVFLIDSAGH